MLDELLMGCQISSILLLGKSLTLLCLLHWYHKVTLLCH